MSEQTQSISLRRRVLRNLAILGGGNGFASLLSLGAIAINSRALSLTEFGTFVLLQTTAMLVAGFFAFGTQQPVIKIGLEALEKNDTERFERLIGMGHAADFLGALAAATVSLAVILLGSDLLHLSSQAAPAALLVAGSLLFQGYRTSEGIFRAFDRFHQLAAIQVGAAAIQVAAAAYLWRIDAPFVAYGALAASAIALPSLSQFFWALILLRRRGLRPRLGEIASAKDDRREFVAYCRSTWATGSLDTLRQNGDAPLVGMLVSVEAAGIYNVARQLAGVLRKGVQIYASVIFPELATLAARRDMAGAGRLLSRILATSAALTVLLVAGSWVFGQLVLGLLFGSEFSAGHTVLVLLFAAGGVQLLSATYSMYVQAFDGPVAVFHAYVAATLGFLAAIVPGLLIWGLPGAGVAQIAFFLILTLACRHRLRKAHAMKEMRG